MTYLKDFMQLHYLEIMCSANPIHISPRSIIKKTININYIQRLYTWEMGLIIISHQSLFQVKDDIFIVV